MSNITQTMDEKIGCFMSLTGVTDSNEAKSFIEMACGNVEQAVNIFMDNPVAGQNSNSSSSSNAQFNGSRQDFAADPEESIRAPMAAFEDQIISNQNYRRMDEKQQRDQLAKDHEQMMRRMEFDGGQDPLPKNKKSKKGCMLILFKRP